MGDPHYLGDIVTKVCIEEINERYPHFLRDIKVCIMYKGHKVEIPSPPQ